MSRVFDLALEMLHLILTLAILLLIALLAYNVLIELEG